MICGLRSAVLPPRAYPAREAYLADGLAPIGTLPQETPRIRSWPAPRTECSPPVWPAC